MSDIKKQLIIWYNPECSKCRTAKDLAEANNCDISIREYLQQPPGREELEILLAQLNIPASELVRKNEPLFQEKFGDQELSPSEWIDALIAYPELMERPLILYGNKAIIGRPPAKILDLLQDQA